MKLLPVPKKPEGVDAQKSAYLIGSGLAALSAACYPGPRRPDEGRARPHVLEKDPIPGGACDGYKYQDIGYVMRGGREMDNHFECMWDLFRSIPSIEDENVTVLDEYYWLNKARPQLQPVPRHRQPRPGCPHRWQVRPVGQGCHGDPEAVHDPGRAAVR